MLNLYKKISFKDVDNRVHHKLSTEDSIKCDDIINEFITKFKAKHLS